jgi:hypothetical protein
MADAKSEKPILTGLTGRYLHQYWVLDQDSVIIGRDENCDISIPERQISRHHARLFRQDGAFYLEDLNSRNGTWINNTKLEGVRELNDGDEIELALVAKLQFVGSGATAPLPFEVPNVKKLRIDLETRRVFIDEQEVDPPLSLPQYRLIELLYLNKGRICTRDQVVETVWPDAVGEGVSEQAIDALVRRLRDRLAEIDPDEQYIVTVRGHGFRLGDI